MGTRHFSQMFRMPREATILEVIRIVRTLPRFVEEEEEEALNKTVTLEEIEVALKWFKKDKILGLDGWPIKFYLTFFYHVGVDLLIEIEECKLSRKMHEGLNSTFIALIPKVDNPQTFDDY